MVLVGRRKAGAVEHPPFDCHRDHGPYAGVDSFLTTLAHNRPRLAAAHAVELAAIAPALDPAPRRPAQEQPIRFHPARRTAALAYGAAEFAGAWAADLRAPVTVHFVHTADADETTAELLAALERRLADTPLRLDLRADGPPPAPPDARPEALRAALGDSLARGFYHHAARVARRGRATTHDPALRWSFTTGLATALAALDQASEAIQLYAETRTTTTDPKILMSAAYATAMLYARHLPPAEQDPAAARDWLGRALRLAAEIEEPRQRVVTTVFYEQGIALLDSREGDPAGALEIIDRGLGALATVLSPGERPQDWARLLHNRAQVYLALGDRDRALAGLDEVIERDPGNCEYYADRAALHRAAGHDRAAFDDYAAAIRLGPHLPEAYYNRATLHDEHGRTARAREDLRRVLAIDPRHVDARVALANLDLARAALDEAEACVRDGLRLSPAEPVLLCTLGLLRSERGDLGEADRLLTAALSADPGLAEAWTNRAAVRFEQGDPAAALADLDHAIALSAAPEPRFNRATALVDLGRYAEAERDFTAALAVPDLDPLLRKEIRAGLTRVRTAVASASGRLQNVSSSPSSM